MPLDADESLHESMCWGLAKRLKSSGLYQSVRCHVPYRALGYPSEADIITQSKNAIHYYEVKCRYHPNNFRKAMEQFRHFQATNQAMDVKYIYITDGMVKRVRL